MEEFKKSILLFADDTLLHANAATELQPLLSDHCKNRVLLSVLTKTKLCCFNVQIDKNSNNNNK